MNNTQNFEGPRRAEPDELDSILVLGNEVMRLGQARKPTIATDYSFVYNRKNAENITIVKDGDRVVSMAGMWPNTVEAGRARLRAGGINCLATLPGYRGYRLATKVMQAAIDHMINQGCHVGRLTTDINDWYHRLGWQDAGSLCTYRINHSNVVLLPVLPDDVIVTDGTTFNDEIVAAIVCLRQADQLGGGRTEEIMRELLAADNDSEIMGNPRYVLARQDETPVAYCLDTNHGIVEWGGPVDLVAGLIREWFGKRIGNRGGRLQPGSKEKVAASQELTLVAPASGHPFAELLRSLSLPCSTGYWGMLYVIDPRGILDAFGLTDIDVTEANGQFTLTRGSESVDVSRQELAKLLFGPERISDFASDVLPVGFWEWPIEHV